MIVISKTKHKRRSNELKVLEVNLKLLMNHENTYLEMWGHILRRFRVQSVCECVCRILLDGVCHDGHPVTHCDVSANKKSLYCTGWFQDGTADIS